MNAYYNLPGTTALQQVTNTNRVSAAVTAHGTASVAARTASRRTVIFEGREGVRVHRARRANQERGTIALLLLLLLVLMLLLLAGTGQLVEGFVVLWSSLLLVVLVLLVMMLVFLMVDVVFWWQELILLKLAWWWWRWRWRTWWRWWWWWSRSWRRRGWWQWWWWWWRRWRWRWWWWWMHLNMRGWLRIQQLSWQRKRVVMFQRWSRWSWWWLTMMMIIVMMMMMMNLVMIIVMMMIITMMTIAAIENLVNVAHFHKKNVSQMYILARRLTEWVTFLHTAVMATVVMCRVRNPTCTATSVV